MPDNLARDVFPEAPLFLPPPPQELSVFIDYQAVADQAIYDEVGVHFDHSRCVMEDWMWEQHMVKLQHFWETGIYARLP